MGPSGSGKSTLFNMIGGLDKPSEGKVYIDEVDIAQLDSLRAGVDALPQDRLHLPDVQPDPGHDGAGERHAADDLRRPEHRRRAGQGGGRSSSASSSATA